jgi:hypothetical protein
VNRPEYQENDTTQVSFRLRRELVKRMQTISRGSGWPPPPSQTEIVTRGIELVLSKLEQRKKLRAKA